MIKGMFMPILLNNLCSDAVTGLAQLVDPSGQPV
jgi:hypothetical protein